MSKREYPVFEKLLEQNFGKPIKEHRFHPTRLWRFDYAYPELNIAIEIEGLTRPGTKSRHTENKGYTEDCHKYNQAVLLGWRVIRFPQTELMKKQTWDFLTELFNGSKGT